MYNKEDIAYLAIFFTTLVAIGIMYASQILSREWAAIMAVTIVLLAAGNPLIKTWIMQRYTKTFSRGITDYWTEVTQEILETSNKQPFHYNFKIPQNYMPTEHMEYSELNIATFTINREELIEYGTKYVENDMPEDITIFYQIAKQKIIGRLPINHDQAKQYIKDNKELFTKITATAILPQRIIETQFGQITKSQ